MSGYCRPRAKYMCLEWRGETAKKAVRGLFIAIKVSRTVDPLSKLIFSGFPTVCPVIIQGKPDISPDIFNFVVEFDPMLEKFISCRITSCKMWFA